MKMGLIKVLVVDDSVFMRKLLSDMLNADPALEVIATARNGEDALEKLQTFEPDVITLDLVMPKKDGFSTLKEIMAKKPTPVIILSAHSQREADITIQCLEAGAAGFILKPSGEISLDIAEVRNELIKLIKQVARVSLPKLKEITLPKIFPVEQKPVKLSGKIVVIGASTGGPVAIEQLLSQLPLNFPVPLVIAQHMPAAFTNSYAKRLQKICPLNVKEAKKNEELKPGTILIAPGDQHTRIERKNGKIIIACYKPKNKHEETPSINQLMESAAEVYGKHTIGVLLTGMGEDGVEGLKAIKKKKGLTLAQDESTSLIYGMPGRAKEENVVDYVLPLSKINKKIIELLS